MSNGSSESKVQLNPEGTGPKVRTEQYRAYSEDGLATPRDVEQQVVVLANRFGDLLESESAYREELLAETRRATDLLAQILDRLH